MNRHSSYALLVLFALSGCLQGPGGGDASVEELDHRDAGRVDAGAKDAGTVESDAGGQDAGVVDSGVTVMDAGEMDAGSMVDAGEGAGSFDAGAADAGEQDAGWVMDAGMDAGADDAGVIDAGQMDAGVVDAGVVDAGVDAGAVDAGPPGSLQWSAAWGETKTQQADAVVTDSHDNIILTGRLDGAITFNGVTLTSAGATDILLAKFDPQGRPLWSKRFGDSASFQYGNSVAVDVQDNVIFVGQFQGTVDFGGGAFTSAGGDDLFIAKFDAQGQHLWSKSFGSADDGQVATAVAVAPDGSIVMLGQFQGTMSLGGADLVSVGSTDVFLAKFETNGTFRWSKSFGDESAQKGKSMAVDADGNIVIGVELVGTADFGGGALTSAGASDVAVAKFTPGGMHLWSKRFGDTSKQYVSRVSFDGQKNVILAGDFEGKINFGGVEFSATGTLDRSIYVAKFDAAGTHLWSKGMGDDARQLLTAMTVDATGAIICAGQYKGTLNFGSGNLPMSASTYHFYAAKLAADGTPVWTKATGTTGDYVSGALTTDRTQSVVLVGRFWGLFDLGGTPLSSATADYNLYIAKFLP